MPAHSGTQYPRSRICFRGDSPGARSTGRAVWRSIPHIIDCATAGDNCVYHYPEETGAPHYRLRELIKGRKPTLSTYVLAWHDRTKRVAFKSTEQVALLVGSLASGKLTANALHGVEDIRALTFSPDGNQLAALLQGDTVGIFEIDDRNNITATWRRTFSSPINDINKLVFDASSRLLAVSNCQHFHCYEIPTIEGSSRHLFMQAFADDQETIADVCAGAHDNTYMIIGNKGTVHLFDAGTKEVTSLTSDSDDFSEVSRIFPAATESGCLCVTLVERDGQRFWYALKKAVSTIKIIGA